MSAEQDGGARGPRDAQDPQREDRKIGLVLAGGGARGAYEIGALSVLLPELAASGQRVTVMVGTSAGALNSAWLASNVHQPVQSLVEISKELWLRLRWEDVVGPLWSPRSLKPAFRFALEILGGSSRISSLLDSRPLARTVAQRLDAVQLQKNVQTGLLHAVAVVATATDSGDSVVFHSGGGLVKHDPFRAIRYVPVTLSDEHVLASAAIPAAFRPARINQPPVAQGWYVDGGTRLNTPIKPALALGADEVIVVGLNSIRTRGTDDAETVCPDVFQGVGHLTQAILADPLAHDVRTLATINLKAASGHDPEYRLIPYVLVEPRLRDRIGEIAREVYLAHYASPRGLRTSVGALGRLLRADAGRANGELFSYLFFAPEFAEALLDEGAADAQRWLTEPHDDGIWQHGPLDKPAPHRQPSATR